MLKSPFLTKHNNVNVGVYVSTPAIEHLVKAWWMFLPTECKSLFQQPWDCSENSYNSKTSTSVVLWTKTNWKLALFRGCFLTLRRSVLRDGSVWSEVNTSLLIGLYWGRYEGGVTGFLLIGWEVSKTTKTVNSWVSWQCTMHETTPDKATDWREK